jgi:ABC-type polysaccharide/polyol phosphate export permease
MTAAPPRHPDAPVGEPAQLAELAPPPPTPRPPLVRQLRARTAELWRVRGLLYQLALRDVRIRYKQALFGFGWALLAPALVVLAGVTLRLTLARGAGHSTGLSAVAGIAVKATPWSFFAAAVGVATSSLTSNAALLTKVYFPREALPLGVVLAHLVDLAAGLLTVGVIVAVTGAPLTPALLWVPVLLAVLVVLTVAASILLSCLNLFFRDVKYIVQVLLTFGIFFTPVFFDLSMLDPRIAQLLMLNPLAPILEGLRLAVVEGHALTVPLAMARGASWHPWYLGYAAAWAVGGLLAAVALFARLERRFADYV